VRLALDFFRNTTRRGFESFFVLVTVIFQTPSREPTSPDFTDL
jgi:hypothetical protein